MNLATATRHAHRGIEFYVGPRTPFPGLGWAIPWSDGRRTHQHESQGAFYDGCSDHPEGASAWAEASCRSAIDRYFLRKVVD